MRTMDPQDQVDYQRYLLDRLGIGIVPTDPIRVDNAQWFSSGRVEVSVTLFDQRDGSLFADWMEASGWRWTGSAGGMGGPQSVTWEKYEPKPLTDSDAKMRMARYGEKVAKRNVESLEAQLRAAQRQHAEAQAEVRALETATG